MNNQEGSAFDMASDFRIVFQSSVSAFEMFN